MRILVQLTKNELIKLYEYRPFLYLVLSMCIVLLISGYAFVDKSFIKFPSQNGGDNQFTLFYLSQYLFISVFGIVLFNFICVLLMKMETDNNSWKYLLSLPIPPHLILVSKILAGFTSNLALISIMLVLIVFESMLIPLLPGRQNFSGYDASLILVLSFFLKFFLLSLSVTAFHFIIYFFLRNQTLMILISVIMPIACLFDHMAFLPYGWPVKSFWLIIKDRYSRASWVQILNVYELLSLLITCCVFGLVFHFRNRVMAQFRFLI